MAYRKNSCVSSCLPFRKCLAIAMEIGKHPNGRARNVTKRTLEIVGDE